MKTRETADQTRSSVTGKVIKLKVKKTAEDKEVCIYKILLLNTVVHAMAPWAMQLQRFIIFSAEGYQPKATA